MSVSENAGTGPERRAVLKAGIGGAALAVTGLGTVAARPASAAELPPLAAGRRDGKDWRSYVRAPAGRTVRPVRVVSSTGDVTDADALLKPGGGVTVLTRPAPVAPPAWPQGTTAAASSTHAPNSGDDGTPRTYDASNAIDGDPGTFWNDDTIGVYPDTLTITAPQAVSLPGVTLLSGSDGVPTDFTVDTWDGTAWRTAATVTGNSDVQRPVPFASPVSTTRVRITVTGDQQTSAGEFTRVNEVYPGVVDPVAAPGVLVDFGQVVVGFPTVRFAWASSGNPGVRLAFSETLEYLTDRSDFTRSDQSGGQGQGTDQFAVPSAGATWTDDRRGYRSGGNQVYADGLHGFRYLRITLDALAADAPAARAWGKVAVDTVSLDFTGYLGTPDTFAGWFLSSDDDLNRYWYGAAYTNELVTDTFRTDDVDPRGADSPTLDGKLVLHDGAKRDRDPYVGDLAVSARTLYLTHPDASAAARDVLADLADHQRDDGWIPPASINGYTLPLFDYPLWWVTCSWDYLLHTGDHDYATRYYPALGKLLDSWYPSVTDGDGLLNKGLNGTSGYGDYAFLPRSGQITYYNANYVQALNDAAALAGWLGHTADADRWTARARSVADAINAHLWDASAGAYLDSATGDVRHAQDGNSIAITAGVADPTRAASALAHLDATTKLPYGNAFMDNDTIFADASKRVYAFTSYPELVARFRSGQADSAVDQIKRTYGWMDAHDPGTTNWEGIGPDGTPYEQAYTSMAHGWSTGVLPALTRDLLGAEPTAPGFTTWQVTPHPGTVAWAQGRLPTPHGPLTVSWDNPGSGAFTLDVDAPHGTTGTVAVPVPAAGQRFTVRLDGRTAWDGTRAAVRGARLDDGRLLLPDLGPGRHTVTVHPAGHR
ncbi:alpha-L-rhamnosidase-related protein [Streptantibioticus silvisoli]|uniref:Alpha-L-rhamnosidase C-terminal domain-containing protein n=1 Tax=Streptantibioticus silvisoli TaxID=2705255 RepID=A0ABT6VZ92_9ACTN|nr:alpha-L-rhamnosidase C-terminal domain-containing protein [Streptantibioticus silvisoli]MDI5963800.1 alpha-L-rhamnosidase C-terminal domain-containing protein [Streptantibioticus silvisoli]